MAFREASIKLTKAIPLAVKKEQGIYFTPKSARDVLFSSLPPTFAPTLILEPSFGSGEFIQDARERWPSVPILAVEKNRTIYNAYTPVLNVKTFCDDFLNWESTDVPDLIIGNPPYFVTKDPNPDCMTGRPNIYIAILYKCFRLLAPNGLLAFVLPTSLLNSSYYNPMREVLATESTIVNLQLLDASFSDTAQPTLLLMVQKTPPLTTPYVLRIGSATLLSPKATRLQELLSEGKSMKSLGLRVKTGEVVWNQIQFVEDVDVQAAKKSKSTIQKGTLTHDPHEATILYYSGNLKGTELSPHVDHPLKKPYLKDFKKDPMVGPAILMSRGYGNTFSFTYAYIPEEREFYAENHVNVIKAIRPSSAPALERLHRSLSNPKTAEFLHSFVGNGSLSKTELEEMLPVF